MKKFILILIAAVAMSAPAGNLTISNQALKNPERMVPGRTIKSSTNMKQIATNSKAAVSKRSEIESLPVITEQPDGELVSFTRSGECIYNSPFGLMIDKQGGKANVVFTEDGKVYLQDPIFGADVLDTWVEGSMSEDGITITVPMGQCVFWDDEGGYGMILSVVNLYISEDGELSYEVDEDANEITYTINGTTLAMNDTYGDMNADYPTQMRGLGGLWTDNMEFSGYLDWNTVYSMLVAVPAIPADPSLDPVDTGHPKAWVDGGDESGGSRFHHFIRPVDVDGNPMDPDLMTYSIFTDDDQVFTFKAATYFMDELTEDMTELPYTLNGIDLNPITTWFYRTNAEGYERLFNQRIGIQVYYTVDGIRNASNIVYYEANYADNGVPENPIAEEWSDCGNESGISIFFFTISENTIDGKHMDPSRMYYSIFTDDDQQFTFNAANYSHDFNEDMTMVPYLHDGYDITPRAVYFYRTNADGYERFFNHQIGIQVYYQQEDGNFKASDIVYLEVFEPTTGVEEINGNNVAEVARYAVDGRAISAPQTGVNIVKMSDGTVKKVFVK